jgi:hypothetical protein
MKVGVQQHLIADAKDAIRARAWAKAREFEGDFGAADLAMAAECGIELAQTIVKGWLVDGLVIESQMRLGPMRQKVRINPDWRDQAAVVGRTPTDNMWHAARRLRTFGPTDLSAHATTDLIAVSVAEAAAYCRALLAAGYLRVSRKASPKNAREALYTLARDTGPRPPRENRVRAVVDANTGATYLLGAAK